MVSAFGYYASSKGMVLVPNLSGLTRTAAITAIQNAGLTPVAGSIVNTGDSGLDDFIASQTPAAGDLVDYETNVQYNYYDFVPVGPFFPPFFPPYFPTFTPPFFPPYFPTFVPAPSCSGTCSAGTALTDNCNALTGSCTPAGCGDGCTVTCTTYCSSPASSPGQTITATGPCGTYTQSAPFPGARTLIRCCSC